MSIDIDVIIKAMVNAAVKAIDASPEIKESITQVFDNNKASIAELVDARKSDEINQEDFDAELAREKSVLQAELIGMEIPVKASIQRALNAAIEALTNAVSQA